MFRRPLFVLLLAASCSVSAQAYKWVDTHGVVHYTESAPPPGTKYKRITLTGDAEPLAKPAAAPTDSQPADTGPEAVSSNLPMQDTPANRAKLCASLKTNLAALHGNGPVVMQQNGKQVLLDAGQRKTQIDSAQAQYSQYCLEQQ
ncbi:DUF4124 domain-containing protein [Dyella lutea]|uniref:DUF4124 domain-containing protein n=1 Tax=Dyella lutea TaxID=2950441 RepID=A0ABT1F883_9GAMM|nr:DUF4124 domain-containing protein [Dyella lutea]MCP1373551.1 DUF4124 domain-containing protein [Dyella lutea]